MPKNIILLHADQQRQDSLGCYGNGAAQTPNLDRLARDGVRFDHHYSSNPVCMPSRASLLTGRHLPAHGVIDNGIPLDERELTLPAALGEAGYATFSAGKLHLTPYQNPTHPDDGECPHTWRSGVLDDWDGPYYGFQRVRLTIGHGEGSMDPQLGHYGHWLREHHPEVFDLKGHEHAPEPKFANAHRSQVPAEAHHSMYVATQVVEYLEQVDRDKPFFVFGGFPDPHHPFVPPEPYAARFDGVGFPAPRNRDGWYEGRPEHYARLLTDNVFPTDGGACRIPEGEHHRHIVQNTYGMVTLIDDAVGRVLDAVERLGLADDTIVCFTSDHGDLLGDYGLYMKGQVPFASLLRIPFVIRAPGIAPAATSAPMSNTDVMPTLMDLAGVDVPDRVQGKSYRPVLEGTADKVSEAAFSCGWSKESALYRHMSLHGDRWRITWWPGLEQGELYDLEADPYEFENLFDRDKHRATRDRLMNDLLYTYAAAGPLEPHVVACW